MAQCSSQGPCPDCSRGKELFSAVRRLYHRLVMRTVVMSPAAREQLWHDYEMARATYFAHVPHCACF